MRPALPREDLEFILSQTPEFWQRFGGARVFVTGGTGFIGAWLLETLQLANRALSANMEVVVLTRDAAQARAFAPHLFNDPAIHLIEGDISHFTAPAGRFDLCIHAAADVGNTARANNHGAAFNSSIDGTRRVLDLALRSGVQRLLMTSSGAVYGPQPPALDKVPETFTGAPDPLDVTAAYGNGKRAAEWLACEAAQRSRLEVVIARIFALLGPGLPLDGPFAAGNFIRDVLNGNAIQIKGDGRPVRSYLYIADACVWLLQLLMSGQSRQAYNVGSDDGLSIAALARNIEHQASNPGDPALAPENKMYPTATDLPPRYVPDTAKARKTMSLHQHTALGTALHKTIQWNRVAMNV